MDSVDLAVLRRARDWLRDGHAVTLFTVLQTWGSAPRPVGALLALRADGRVEGSVSGGCVEDDLLARAQPANVQGGCELIVYGVSRDETARSVCPVAEPCACCRSRCAMRAGSTNCSNAAPRSSG